MYKLCLIVICVIFLKVFLEKIVFVGLFGELRIIVLVLGVIFFFKRVILIWKLFFL